MDPLNQVPEITPGALAERLKDPAPLVVLDVREPFELRSAALRDPRVVLAPISELANFGLSALPEPVQAVKDGEIVVICHHGIRSAQVVLWLKSLGWQNVLSLAGGLDAYAREIDPTIGSY